MTSIIEFPNSHNPHDFHEVVAYPSETVLSYSVAYINTVESAVARPLSCPLAALGRRPTRA